MASEMTFPLAAPMTTLHWQQFGRVGPYAREEISEAWERSGFQELRISEPLNLWSVGDASSGQIWWPYENPNGAWRDSQIGRMAKAVALPKVLNMIFKRNRFVLQLKHLGLRTHPTETCDLRYFPQRFDRHSRTTAINFNWPVHENVHPDDRFDASLPGKILAERQPDIKNSLANCTPVVELFYKGPSIHSWEQRLHGAHWGSKILMDKLFIDGVQAFKNRFMGENVESIWLLLPAEEAIERFPNFACIGHTFGERANLSNHFYETYFTNLYDYTEVDKITDSVETQRHKEVKRDLERIRRAMDAVWAPDGDMTHVRYMLVYGGPTELSANLLKDWGEIAQNLVWKGLPTAVAERISIESRFAIMKFTSLPTPKMRFTGCVAKSEWYLELYNAKLLLKLAPLAFLEQETTKTIWPQTTKKSLIAHRHQLALQEISPTFMKVVLTAGPETWVLPRFDAKPIKGPSVNPPKWVTRRNFPSTTANTSENTPMWTGKVVWFERKWHYQTTLLGNLGYVAERDVEHVWRFSVNGRVNRATTPVYFNTLVNIPIPR